MPLKFTDLRHTLLNRLGQDGYWKDAHEACKEFYADRTINVVSADALFDLFADDAGNIIQEEGFACTALLPLTKNWKWGDELTYKENEPFLIPTHIDMPSDKGIRLTFSRNVILAPSNCRVSYFYDNQFQVIPSPSTFGIYDQCSSMVIEGDKDGDEITEALERQVYIESNSHIIEFQYDEPVLGRIIPEFDSQLAEKLFGLPSRITQIPNLKYGVADWVDEENTYATMLPVGISNGKRWFMEYPLPSLKISNTQYLDKHGQIHQF